MKYRDYALGAGLESVWEPEVVGLDLTRESLRSRLAREYVSDEKLDEVGAAVRAGIADYRTMRL